MSSSVFSMWGSVLPILGSLLPFCIHNQVWGSLLPGDHFWDLTGPHHMAMSAILYWYAPVRSKRPIGARLHSHRGTGTNLANRSRIGSKFGRYGKANQKSGRFANLPFHSYMNKNDRSTFRTCWVSAGTRKCISFTLSQYIRETLFSCLFFLFLDTSF